MCYYIINVVQHYCSLSQSWRGYRNSFVHSYVHLSVCSFVRHTNCIKLNLGEWAHYGTPQVSLIFPPNSHNFLASDWLSSFATFADKMLIGLSSNLVDELFVGFPKPEQLVVMFHIPLNSLYILVFVCRAVSIHLQTNCWSDWHHHCHHQCCNRHHCCPNRWCHPPPPPPPHLFGFLFFFQTAHPHHHRPPCPPSPQPTHWGTRIHWCLVDIYLFISAAQYTFIIMPA